MGFNYLALVIKLIYALSVLSNHLHKLLLDLILYDYRFQIYVACLASLCQFTINLRKYRKNSTVTKQIQYK